MLQLVYSSRPSPLFEWDDCSHILMQSRRNNPRKGITGALLFTGSYFLQALEGPEDAVLEVLEKISKDPRHEDISSILRKNVDEPEFAKWAMAFERTNLGQGTDLESQVQTLTENASTETAKLFAKILAKPRMRKCA